MKRQSKLVQQLKARIESIKALVILGIKKYIIKLIDLEARLEQAIAAQLPKTIKAMTWTIKAATRRQEGKFWVARIDGLDAKFGFARTFISAKEIEWGKYGMSKAVFQILEPGYYQDSDGDYFRVWVDSDNCLDGETCPYLEVAARFGRVKV